MQFKWKIEKVQVANDNLITIVDLIVTAVDGDKTASAAYICNLEKNSKTVPFEQLTEQQVLNWCFQPIVTTWTDMDSKPQSATRLIKNEGEAQVAGQIARQLAKKAAEPALPWL